MSVSIASHWLNRQSRLLSDVWGHFVYWLYCCVGGCVVLCVGCVVLGKLGWFVRLVNAGCVLWWRATWIWGYSLWRLCCSMGVVLWWESYMDLCSCWIRGMGCSEGLCLFEVTAHAGCVVVWMIVLICVQGGYAERFVLICMCGSWAYGCGSLAK